MEGGGEGVVAVVRGTKHALTVTLLSDHRTSTRKCVDENIKFSRVSHSNVETNTERNFENVKTPTCDVRYANNYRFTDYQSPYVSSVFPQAISSLFKSQDPFTQSLRKYPNERSSAELIQRIINYTRTKSYIRKRHPRSLRSLIRKSKSQTQSTNAVNATQEEYCKAINNSFSSIKTKDLSQNELVNYTYDYLKSSTLKPRNTDVRYFTEMKRAIRGRLRGMIDDKPPICPWIQSRYNRHRQHCHKKNVKTPSGLVSKNIETREARKNVIPPIGSVGIPVLRHTTSSNIISCQSRCKPCFCGRISPCDYDIKINTHEPIQSLHSNLRSEIKQADELISSKEIFDESQKPDDFTTEHDNDTENETFENEINDWLNTIPVYPNFGTKEKVKREQLINKLAKTLKHLQKQSDFSSLAKKEVVQCLDILPMWHPDDSENDVILKRQIVDDLIKRLTNLAETNFKTAISEEVKVFPFDESNISDNIIKRTIDIFIDKLTPIALNRPLRDEDYKRDLKLEVINIIKRLPLRLDNQNSNQILKLADKFVKRLYNYKIFESINEQTIEDKTDEIEKKIFDCCRDIPEISKYTADQYSDLVHFLVKKFHAYKLLNTKDDSIVREFQEEVKVWIDKLAMRFNLNFSPDRKNILSNKLMEKILGADYSKILRNSINENDVSNKILQCIIKWFENAPELSVGNNDGIHMALNNLSFQLKDIQIRNDDIENILADMKETILNWLQQILETKGIQLDSKTQDNLVNNLILKLTDLPTQKNERDENIDLHKDVTTWLKEIPYIKSYDYAEQNNLVKDFIVRLMDIEKTNNQDMTKPIIEEEIKHFVDKICVNSNKNITSEDIDKLKLKVFTQMKISPQRRKLWNKNNNLRHIFFEEISNIVESCLELPNEIKESLKSKITNIIFKNIVDNTVDCDQIFLQVFNMLKQETSLTNNDIDNLGNKITGKVNDVLFRHESKHIPPISIKQTELKLKDGSYKTHETNFSDMQMDTNKSLQDESLYHNDDSKNQASPNYQSSNIKSISKVQDNKIKSDNQKNYTHVNDSQFHDDFSKTLDDIIEKTNTVIEKNDNSISILRNIDIATKIFDKKIKERKAIIESQTKSISGSEHVNKSTQKETTTDKENEKSFLEKDFSTSTPLTSTIKYPTAISNELLSTLNNGSVTKTNQIKEETSEISQYLNKVKNVIKNWLHHFTIHLDEREKYDLINNIAYDIVDRQKYLQLSDRSTSEKEELEHLKYQIYKRLDSLNNHEAISDIISNVDCLNHRIISIKVPKLLQSSQKHKHETNYLNMVSTNVDLVHKITTWFKKLTPVFLNTLNDRKYHEKKILDLARYLQTLKINDQYDSINIKKEIFQWLSSIFNNIDSKKLSDMAESLKMYLVDTDSTETFIPMQDTSEFVVENLSGAIVEWFRTSQYRYKLQNQIQDYFALVLANKIKQVFSQSLSGDELNRLLIQEIIKDLGKITGDLSHSVFHYAIACDLLTFLKELKLFHDISDRETINYLNKSDTNKDIRYKDVIKEAVLNWINRLPLQVDISTRNVNEIINNFIETVLKDCDFDDILNVENVLNGHIVRLLREIPLRIDEKEYNDIEVRVADLVAIIKHILVRKKPMISNVTRDSESQISANQDKSPSEVYKQLLHDTISKTFFEKLTLEEQISFNLLKEKLAEAFINLHYYTDDKEIRNEFKNKLYREISKFCDNFLRSHLVSPIYTDRLQEDLHRLLKNVSLPTITSKENFTEDKLKDEINNWVSDILLNQYDKKEYDIPKMVSTLFKSIYPLFERNKSGLSNSNYDEIKQEIIQWLRKMPFKTELIVNSEEVVNKLIEKLKILTNYKQINEYNILPNECTDENKIGSKREAGTQFTPQLPPTSLSFEEIDYLKRIRARSDIRSKVDSQEQIISKNSTKNTYADIEIQTDIQDKLPKCIQTSNTSVIENLAIHKEITPQVIIREFYWDSNGSKQSLQMFEPTAISPQKTTSPKIKVTSESQTEPKLNYEIESQKQILQEPRHEEVSIRKDIETQTTTDFQQHVKKTHSIHQPQLTEGIIEPQNIISSENLMYQQNKRNGTRKYFSKTKEYVSEHSDQTFENGTIRGFESLDVNRRILKTPRTLKISEKVPPLLATEDRSEQRLYASEYIDTRKNREDKISCSCKNHLLTKCRNKSYSGCRQTGVNNTLKHCSKCFGGYCPHPSYFFFRKDF